MAYRRRSGSSPLLPFVIVLVLFPTSLLAGGLLFYHLNPVTGRQLLGRALDLVRPSSAEALHLATPPPTFTVTPQLPVPLATVPSPQATAQQFLGDWSKQQYAQMYALLTSQAKAAQSEKHFAAWYADMAKTATLTSVSTKITSAPWIPKGAGNGASVQVPYTIQFHTILVGTFQQKNSVPLVLQNGQWRVDWQSSVYFTGLQAKDAVRLFPLNPRRGDILDRKGRPLATTGFEETIGVVPGELAKGGKETQALQAIGQDLHKTTAELQKEFANQPASWFIPLGVVPGSMEQQLHKQLDPIPGVILRRKPIRIYPQGTVASHIVGYVGPVTKQELKALAAQGYTTDDVVGQAGVEKWANSYLAGRKGGILAIVGPSGQVVQVIARRDVVEGDNVVLTIDLDIQKKAEQILNKLDGSVVVLGPKDNSVLALASYPNYNPNNFITGWSPPEWKKFSTSPNQPFLDRPVELAFPTGSVFKVITMSAAMETLGVKTSRTFDCNYWWHGPGMTLHNWRTEGTLNLIQSITGSCDPTFYQLGLELWKKNPSILSQFAKEFGFGQKTEINGVNNEIPGLVPSPAWKEKVYHQPWYAGDSVELAIGQSYLQATPIQVANAYSSLADNGIRRSPLMVQKIVDQKGHVVKTFQAKSLGRLPDSPATLAAIKAGMLGTTSTALGTAYYAFSTYKHPMEVKTGSASNQGKLAHAWFVGYSPPDHPQYVILVMIEGRGESMQIASPMARKLMDYLWPNSSPQPRPW